MTDAPDEPSVHPSERGGVRRTRVGDAGSPVGSTLSIILAVVAVVAGFLILRAITDDDSAGGDVPGVTADTVEGGTDTTVGGGTPTSSAATTTTAAPGQTFAGATIAVANASGVSGTAAQMSAALQTAGYEGVGEPGNATSGDLATTVVHFAPGDAAAQAVAQSIAADLGGVAVQEIPADRPAEGGGVDTATVLIMLGTDKAGQPLGAAAGAATPSTTVVPPPAIITQAP